MIFMGFDLMVFSGDKGTWKEEPIEIAHFHSHYSSSTSDLIFQLLDVTRCSTKDISEDDWEGLDYEGISTICNFKKAKEKLLEIGLENKTSYKKIDEFFSTVIQKADTEILYLDWG